MAKNEIIKKSKSKYNLKTILMLEAKRNPIAFGEFSHLI